MKLDLVSLNDISIYPCPLLYDCMVVFPAQANDFAGETFPVDFTVGSMDCVSLLIRDDGALEGPEYFRLTIGIPDGIIECPSNSTDPLEPTDPPDLCVIANVLQFQIEDNSKLLAVCRKKAGGAQ